MLVYLKRAGGQEKYSEPIQFQTQSSDRFAELVAWMTNNPTAAMSVEILARRASLSPRQFFRRFKEHFGSSPALFVKDGKFYTSAGVTAGIDLALAMIEEDFGSKVALAAAREMVVYLKRSGGQEQYSEPLKFQTDSSDRFADLVTWMTNNPTAAMSVEILARRASLSPRQFFRRFKQHFGSSPAMFVETLRLNEARRRLSAGDPSIDRVAESVGFNGADSFRRAFERRFRVTPSRYRRSFALSPETRRPRPTPKHQRKIRRT